MKFSAKSEAVYDYDTGKRYTYGDLDARSDALSLFLTETLGLKKGDRVGFCATNNIAFYDAFYWNISYFKLASATALADYGYRINWLSWVLLFEVPLFSLPVSAYAFKKYRETKKAILEAK